MQIALFTHEGLLFAFRWFHFLGGITWIGLLYYFNFVQGPFFAETEANVKSAATQKLVPRALWWFRWGAMLTFLTGVAILMTRGHTDGMEIFQTSWGIAILTGGLFGTLMWANVWFVIWPNQKVVIQNAITTASGGAANPAAAGCAARAGVASRTNVLFSIPMLFMRGAASHLTVQVGEESKICGYFIAIGILAVLLEINALKGKTGPMTTVKGVIHCGILLTAVVYALMEFML